MHDSLSACYEARIRGLQATLCASACVKPPSPVALRKQPSAQVACGWHSNASTLAEQQAVAAAVQVGGCLHHTVLWFLACRAAVWCPESFLFSSFGQSKVTSARFHEHTSMGAACAPACCATGWA